MNEIEREREGGREGERGSVCVYMRENRESGRETEGETACVCVCVCMCVCVTWDSVKSM